MTMTAPRLTETEMRAMLQRECDAAGGVKPWAKLHNMTFQFVYLVLEGDRSVSGKICKALGMERCQETYFVASGLGQTAQEKS